MTVRSIAAGLVLCIALAMPAAAFDPALAASARLLSDRKVDRTSYVLPVGPMTAEGLEAIDLVGSLRRRTWRTDGGLTTQQMLDPLLEQLGSEGYDVVYSCSDAECGGFDFRFAIDVAPAPDMFVDIQDFRFVSAMRGPQDAVSLLISGGTVSGHVQVVSLMPSGGAEMRVAAGLRSTGRVILDVRDGTDPQAGAIFDAMASVLSEFPDTQLGLVAHGPSEPGQTRAEALRAAFLAQTGVAPDRVIAASVGRLVPQIFPLLEEADEVNIRIEAVILPAPAN